MKNRPRERRRTLTGTAAALMMVVGACSDAGQPDHATSDQSLAQRAYVVSKDHDELTVIDLRTMEIAGRVATGGLHNHMAELSADLGKVYVQSSGTDETIVVDARTLTIRKRIPVGKHPTHLSLSPDGRLLAVMAEDDDAVV